MTKVSSKPSPSADGRSTAATWRFRIAAAVLLVCAAAYLLAFLHVWKTPDERRGDYWMGLTQFIIIDEFIRENLLAVWKGPNPRNVAFADRVPVFGVALAILAAAVAAGWLLLPLTLRSQLDNLEKLIFAAGVGLNAVSLFTLLVGLCGGLRLQWLWMVALAGVVLAAAGKLLVTRLRLNALPHGDAPDVTVSPKRHWWWLAIAPFTIWLLLVAAIPPYDFDVREYHLQIPKEWYQQGYIDFVPHNVYGNMPLGAEMLALAAMAIMPQEPAWWYGALAGKVLICGFTLLAALSLYAIGRRFFTPAAGMVAAVVYLSTPSIFVVSTTGLVEGAVACYLLLATHALLLWLEQLGWFRRDSKDAAAQPEHGGVYLAGLIGFLAGAAAACKYTSLVLVVVPLGIAVLALGRRVRWRHALVYSLMVLAACSLWYGKNAVLARNPTYPLLYNVFGGRNWDEATHQRWRAAHQPPPDAQGHQYSLRQFFGSAAEVGVHSYQLSLLLIPLALFSFLAVRNRGVVYVVLALIGSYFLLWWLLTHRYERFFLPAFSWVALLAGAGYAWSRSKFWRWPVTVTICAVLLINFILMNSAKISFSPRIFVSLESQRRDPIRVTDVRQYLNRYVKPGGAVLVVGDAEVFDLEMPVYYSTCWNPCTFELWMKGKTREERLQILAEHNISHIYVHWAEIVRYRSPGNYGFTSYVTPQLLRDEMYLQQQIIEPVPVPSGDTILHRDIAEVFEVRYEDVQETEPAP